MASPSARFSVSGRRISDAEVRKGLTVNIICACFAMTWVTASQGLPMTMLMENLKGEGVIISLTLVLQQLAMMLQIPAALVAERLPQRKPFFFVTNLTHRALWFIPAFLPLFMPGGPTTTTIIILCAIGLSSVFAQMAVPPWMSWMADLVPENIRGRFWGRRQSWCMAAYLVAMFAAGKVLDAFPDPKVTGDFTGFTIVFGFCAAMGCMDIILHWYVPEPRPTPIRNKKPIATRIRELWAMPDFRRLTLTFSMWSFGCAIPGAFSFVYLKREYAVTYSQLTLLVVASSLSITILSSIWGTIMDRLGSRAFGILMMFSGPVASLSWFFIAPPGDITVAELLAMCPLGGSSLAAWVSQYPGLGGFGMAQPMWLVLVVNFLFGSFYGGVGLCQMDMISRLTPKEGRTLAMGLHWTIIGAVAAIGSIIGGNLVDWVTAHPLPGTWHTVFGQHMGFIHILALAQVCVCWFLAIPLLLRVTRQPKDSSVSQAFATLFARNPFRTIGAVYNIHAVGAAKPSWVRARAVRELGESRSEIAVKDLVEKLDDPSSSVREEAITALGQIGSNDAIDALVAKLDDPDTDLSPQIARALRSAPSARSLPTLVKKMSESTPDRETKAEVARTLGAIGDKRAVPLLIRTLQVSDDAKVISASSDALAHMGELAAIYEIIPHMKAARNPVLKRSLAVAVGNLLGRPDGFYMILHREQKERGSQGLELTKAIERQLRELGNETTFTVECEQLAKKAREIAACYEAEQWRDAMGHLFNLSIGIAAVRYGVEFGEDSKAFMEDLVWHDERFGTGVWFIDLMLRRDEVAAAPLDSVDVLLGLYFLTHHLGVE